MNDFITINTQIITALHSHVMNVFEITPNEIELFGVILRGILKDPDVVEDSSFEQILQMLERIGDASIYAHYPITIDIRDTYMDSLSAIMNKLFHSYKVKRAVSNVVKLAKSQSVSDQFSFVSS